MTRALVAVAALYAVLLQAFLLGALPAGPAGLHDPVGLCAPSGDPERADHSPATHAGAACCILGCAGLVLTPPLADAAILLPPLRLVLDARPATTHLALPRGPPRHAHTPRGPPAA